MNNNDFLGSMLCLPRDFKVGVKQGDSVAPDLFLFIVMAFAETLEKE